MKCEIDINLGPLADEWEPVGFRHCESDENYVVDGRIYRGPTKSDRLVVRRRWQWPEWLTAEWIAMDKDGTWFASNEVPEINNCIYEVDDSVSLDENLIAWTPPPCTDWRQSKRRNPNSKATT